MNRMSQRRQREMNHEGSSPYAYLIFGFVLLVATILLVARILAHTAAGGTVIAAGLPVTAFVIATATYLGVGFMKLSKQRRDLPSPFSGPAEKERELLSAIQASGDGITPAEAAVETSLTVREADRMLSELANDGYLRVEGRGGALYYSLPGKRTELGS